MKRLYTYSLPLFGLCLFITLFLAYSPIAAKGGSTIAVNSTADAVDASPGDGICETANGNNVCTLRAAVQETNALPGADIIQIPSGTFTLTIPGIETIAAAGDLDIRDDLTIIGGGQGQTIIDGNHLDRVIQVVCADYPYPIAGESGQGSSCESDISVSISQVTIRNGFIDPETSPLGAGIFNAATLILDNVTIRDNEGDEKIWTTGGGIANYGVLTMTHSLVTDNLGVGLSGSSGYYNHPITSQTYIADSQIINNSSEGIRTNCCEGGGAYMTIERSLISGNGGAGIVHIGRTLRINQSSISNNEDGGLIIGRGASPITTEITSSTISDNYSSGLRLYRGDVIISNSTISNNIEENNGGGIYFGGPGTSLSIINSTIVQNSSMMGGGIFVIYNDSKEITIVNSIVADNSGGNCTNVLVGYSNGHNLEDGTDCNFTAPGDLQNSDPMLGPLQYNGGSTSTHALLTGSPAADAGDNTICQSAPINSLDQRRYSRVGRDGNMDGGTDGDPCDIGAFEISAAPTSVQLTNNLESGPNNSRYWVIAVSLGFLALVALLGFRQRSLSAN